MTPYELVLSKIPSAKKKHNGHEGQCPVHEDKRASLSIREGDDGRVLLKCHAGCATGAICKALNLTMRDLFPQPPGNQIRAKVSSKKSGEINGKIVATYDYLDKQYKLLFQVVRFEPKDFRQRRPKGNGAWIWNMKGIQRVLYRLPELIAAGIEVTVFIVEGEKDVERLRSLGLVATCNPGGAGKWSIVDDTPLHGRFVVIIVDNDAAGFQHGREVAKSLHGRAREVRLIQLPGVPPKGDVSDYLNQHTVEELQTLITQSQPITDMVMLGDEAQAPSDLPEVENRKTSIATGLIELAAQAELFHNANGEAYATIRQNGHHETWPIRGKRFKSWLSQLYYAGHDRAPGTQAIQDALLTIEAKAIFGGPEIEAYVRRAEFDAAVYYDLCDKDYRVIKVSADGWKVLSTTPVKFIRRHGMLALPAPERGGSLEELRDFVNIPCDNDFILAVAWVLGAMRPSGPYPILTVNGEQGSAKSTTCRALRQLIDPNAADLQAQPRDERDLVIAARNSAVLGFDNLSIIAHWLSDALCRISTGAGFRTRELYSNDDEIILSVQKPIIINGIEELATRSDLLDRTIQLTLPTLDDASRKMEASFWQEFNIARPRILGALFDAVAMALRNLESVRLDAPTRMADFCQWVASAEPSLPWTAGAFIEAHTRNRDSGHELALESSPLASVLLSWIENEPLQAWTGSATELMRSLEASLPKVDGKPLKPDGWPKRSNLLSGQLARLAPNLRAHGIKVDRNRDKSLSRIRTITITRTASKNIVQHRPTVQNHSPGDAIGENDGRSMDDTPPTLDDHDLPNRTHLDDLDDVLPRHSGTHNSTEVDDVERAEREAIQAVETDQELEDHAEPGNQIA